MSCSFLVLRPRARIIRDGSGDAVAGRLTSRLDTPVTPLSGPTSAPMWMKTTTLRSHTEEAALMASLSLFQLEAGRCNNGKHHDPLPR